MSCWRLEDLINLLVEEVVAAVDAVAVDREQNRDAVSGPGSDLGGVSAAVQPTVTRRRGAGRRGAGEPAGG
jgi:hypothetical protein